jgi:hypothetical protein
MKPSWRWFEAGLFVVGLVLHLYIALSPANSLMKWYSTDDAFYYYKVAMNITSGHGVTFDGINPTNGFHPLWMLICIPVFWLGKFDLILPLRALVLVSAVLSIGTGVLLFRLLKKYISIEISAVLAVVWVFQPFIRWIVVMNGMESTVSAFFIAAFFYSVMHWQDEEITTGKLIKLGLVGGLAILARLDNIFIVMLLGCWFVLKPLGSYVRNLIVSDLAMIFIAVLLSYFIRLRAGLFYQEYSISLSSFLVLAFLLKPLLFYLFGRYQPLKGAPRIRTLVQTLLAVTISSLLIACGQLFLHYFNLVATLPRSATIVGQIIIIDWVGTLLGAWGLQLVIGWLALSSSSDEQDKPWELQSWDVWKSLLLRGFWLYIPIAMLMGIFLLWSHQYAGTFMPVSGQIKHWWAGLPNTVYGSAIKNNRQLFGWNAWELAFSYFTSISGWVRGFFNPRTGRTVVLVVNRLIGISLLILAISHRRAIVNLLLNRMGLFVIFLGLYAHIFYYTSTSYIHTRQWYWVGEMFFTVLLLGVLLEPLRMILERWGGGKWIWNSAMLIIVVAVLYSSIEQNVRHFPYQVQPEKQDAYLSEMRFLEKVTDPDTLIGMTGGGTTAYFINGRTIVNMDGLINSGEYFELLKSGNGALFWDEAGLDYVFGRPYTLLESDPYGKMLTGRLSPLVSFSGRTLYKYGPTGNNNK